MNSVTCTKCGVVVYDQWCSLCPECHAFLPDCTEKASECIKCGTALDEEFKIYCPKCGPLPQIIDGDIKYTWGLFNKETDRLDGLIRDKDLEIVRLAGDLNRCVVEFEKLSNELLDARMERLNTLAAFSALASADAKRIFDLETKIAEQVVKLDEYSLIRPASARTQQVFSALEAVDGIMDNVAARLPEYTYERNLVRDTLNGH